jgi:hypothetical protein
LTVGLFATGQQGNSSRAETWRVTRASFNPSSFARAPANYTISVLTISQDGNIIAANHPAMQQLQTLTGYNIRLDYVLIANFAD